MEQTETANKLVHLLSVKVMPSLAIESANAVVENAISEWSQGSGSEKAKITQFIICFNLHVSHAIIGK